MLDPTFKLYDAVRITQLREPNRADLGERDVRKPEVGDVAWIIEIYQKSTRIRTGMQRQERNYQVDAIILAGRSEAGEGSEALAHL